MIGVLALQGAFAKHREMLAAIGVESQEIRYADELRACQGLILPGGESTVMLRLLREQKLLDPLKNFTGPIFGTCAGLILMSLLGLLDVKVERNSYGRQSASFAAKMDSPLGVIEGCFIRAPKITEICSADVEVLARFQNIPVLVKQGHHIGCAFHPELSENSNLHAFFSKQCALVNEPSRI